jgi:hypothetical protein
MCATPISKGAGASLIAGAVVAEELYMPPEVFRVALLEDTTDFRGAVRSMDGAEASFEERVSSTMVSTVAVFDGWASSIDSCAAAAVEMVEGRCCDGIKAEGLRSAALGRWRTAQRRGCRARGHRRLNERVRWQCQPALLRRTRDLVKLAIDDVW